MNKKKVTIKDVAKAAGVSVTTVSQSLNGNGSRFSPRTIKRIQRAKEKLGYEPDYFAQRMIMKKSKMIGVLVPDITNPFFNSLVRGIENVLYQYDFMTMLCNADMDQGKEDRYLTELTHRGVDGFIIASSSISNEAIQKILRGEKFPFIVLDQKKSEGISDAVLTNDFSGGQQAAQHLWDLGHRQVAVVMPENATENIQNRLRGFQTVFGEDEIVRVDAELSKKSGRKAAQAVINSPATAIFAVNDQIALGLYLGMADQGCRIPEDYSVIGYDNIDMCEYVVPQLTTIAQPIFELGQTTAKMLIDRIEKPNKQWEEELLPVQLVKRFSTARLN